MALACSSGLPYPVMRMQWVPGWRSLAKRMISIPSSLSTLVSRSEIARLHAALTAGPAPEGVRIIGVECLSACNTGCAVSLTKPGAWSYVYGRLTLDDVPAILDGAAKYAASADGIVPWRDRPTVFRKQSIARIPPHPLPEAAE